MQRPRTIKELVAEAENYQFSTATSFRAWLHAARTVLRQADIYCSEQGHAAEAYLLYSRFANLVMYKLREHPDFRRNGHHRQVQQLVSEDIPRVLNNMEALRPTIEKDVESYLAFKQKQLEYERDRMLRQAVQQKQSLVKQAVPRGVIPGSFPDRGSFADRSSLSSAHSQGSDDYRQTLASLQRIRDGRTEFRPKSQAVAYPSISDRSTSVGAIPVGSLPVTPPEVPPKDLKERPSGKEHKSRFNTEGGIALRTTFVPAGLRQKFLAIAEPNTRRNLETCGILCGKMNRNAFFINHLVIPPQQSTSDTCSTTDEEVLFEYVDNNDLFILGWIHTHPTQSCFLSSIDLHTQNGYQIMLPEAIAIVCSPQHNPSYGIFRLTDPRGIDIIKACPKSSTFHPHNEENLYKTAYEPGHVVMRDELPFETKDLRP